jgi:hypothetical protein
MPHILVTVYCDTDKEIVHVPGWEQILLVVNKMDVPNMQIIIRKCAAKAVHLSPANSRAQLIDYIFWGSFVQDFSCTHFLWTVLTQAPCFLQIHGPHGPIFTLPSPPPIPPPSVIGYHLPNSPFLNPLVPPRYVMPRPATTLNGSVVC